MGLKGGVLLLGSCSYFHTMEYNNHELKFRPQHVPGKQVQSENLPLDWSVHTPYVRCGTIPGMLTGVQQVKDPLP